MARTVMLSNEMYGELKSRKGKYSFSEYINRLIEKGKRKTIGNLFNKHYGALEGDKEYDDIMRKLKKEWKKWKIESV